VDRVIAGMDGTDQIGYQEKKLRIAAIVIAVLFTNPLLYRSLVLQWQPGPVSLDSTQKYSAGIVLGGMAGYDKYDRGYFGGSADRFIQTANLYHRGIIQKIIISGGTGSLRQNEPPKPFSCVPLFSITGS
jgi:vancomycin permeability regulator SanA